MKSVHLSESNIIKGLHLETGKKTFIEVEKAILETNGRISFIVRKQYR